MKDGIWNMALACFGVCAFMRGFNSLSRFNSLNGFKSLSGFWILRGFGMI